MLLLIYRVRVKSYAKQANLPFKCNYFVEHTYVHKYLIPAQFDDAVTWEKLEEVVVTKNNVNNCNII